MLFAVIFYFVFQTNLPIVTSVIDKSDGYYEASIDAYKKSEQWDIWSLPISPVFVASSTKTEAGRSYSFKNSQDANLNTAWVAGNSNGGVGEYFVCTFQFPENEGYSSAYQFRGICSMFNGYCKSPELWAQNSRVKRLKVYYNNTPLCFVDVVDTWHLQIFDISKFFKNRKFNQNLDAKYEIKNGDKMKFEIVEVYKGSKYNDLAISEFLCKAAGN
jgi:hypothetical protein